MMFRPPCYFTLQSRFVINSTDEGPERPWLNIIVLPVSPGKSRVMIMFALPAAASGISKLIPSWFIHQRSMKFLDSDIWVHDQERRFRRPPNSFQQLNSNVPIHKNSLLMDTYNQDESYALMTTSDISCSMWRQWWKKHM